MDSDEMWFELDHINTTDENEDIRWTIRKLRKAMPRIFTDEVLRTECGFTDEQIKDLEDREDNR